MLSHLHKRAATKIAPWCAPDLHESLNWSPALASMLAACIDIMNTFVIIFMHMCMQVCQRIAGAICKCAICSAKFGRPSTRNKRGSKVDGRLRHVACIAARERPLQTQCASRELDTNAMEEAHKQCAPWPTNIMILASPRRDQHSHCCKSDAGRTCTLPLQTMAMAQTGPLD